jgi:hypothetical protein
MQRPWHSWIETGTVIAKTCGVVVAYFGIIALMAYPVFEASRGLA